MKCILHCYSKDTLGTASSKNDLNVGTASQERRFSANLKSSLS